MHFDVNNFIRRKIPLNWLYGLSFLCLIYYLTLWGTLLRLELSRVKSYEPTFAVNNRGNVLFVMDENKKNERKRKRFMARLKSSKDINCTNVPGPFIVLCNVGQATGLTKEIVSIMIENFSLDLAAPKLIAVKGESHSFLVFKNTEEATLFYNTCNYKEILSYGTVYMNYVDTDTEIVCQHKNPDGLVIIENFITDEEEKHLIEIFDWTEDIDSTNLKNRQVKHFGYEFRYGSNDVDLNSPLVQKIPDECDLLWTRFNDHGLAFGKPDQLTVNKYIPGQGIPSHVDKHSPFGDTILSLSLGSSVVMDWKHHSGKYLPTFVPTKSMLIMRGEARYDWQHGIQSRTWDPVIEYKTIPSGDTEEQVVVITNDVVARQVRISLTFRWTRRGPCSCDFKTLCDSAQNNYTEDIKDELASNLEDLHVHQVYEQIAGHFSTTRHKPWPRVVEFMRRVAPGAVVLDLGCGNGKNILNRNDIMQLACERSGGLVLECRRRLAGAWGAGGADCVRLDALHAALRDACADAVLCVAVVHHFGTKARRLQAVSTIARLLRTDGRALITVWAKDQTKSNYLSKNKVQETNEEVRMTVAGVNLPVHENRTQFQHSDLLVPWKLRSLKENKLSNQPENTLLRYYHVFEENELAELINEIPNLIVEQSFYEEGNWCVICKKV